VAEVEAAKLFDAAGRDTLGCCCFMVPDPVAALLSALKAINCDELLKLQEIQRTAHNNNRRTLGAGLPEHHPKAVSL